MQLCNWALAWLYSGFRSRLYILFDKDKAGIRARESIVNSEVYKLKASSSACENCEYLTKRLYY